MNDGMKTDLRKTKWQRVDWSHLAQDRNQCQVIVNRLMNLRVQ